MCAVRALTEGVPAVRWTPTEPGATISGVVLKMGTLDSSFGLVPFVDLWTGGTGRVRVNAYPSGLRHVLATEEPQVGDTLWLWFDGFRTIERGPRAGQERKVFSGNVQRGH